MSAIAYTKTEQKEQTMPRLQTLDPETDTGKVKEMLDGTQAMQRGAGPTEDVRELVLKTDRDLEPALLPIAEPRSAETTTRRTLGELGQQILNPCIA